MSRSPRELLSLRGPLQEPVDGIRDYVDLLRTALEGAGRALRPLVLFDRAHPPRLGWRRLWSESGRGRSRWWLVQYTHFMWPWRGFPLAALALVLLLRLRGAKVAFILHDPGASEGGRLRDRARRLVQAAVVRAACRLSQRIVTTVDPGRVELLRPIASSPRVACIPPGSNLPADPPRPASSPSSPVPAVVVFGISPNRIREEAGEIGAIVSDLSRRTGALRLVVGGFQSERMEEDLRRAVSAPGVAIEVLGLAPGPRLAAALGGASVQLSVRGDFSSRRGTLAAGVAAGLPIVGYRHRYTGHPLTEAGIRCVEPGDRDALVAELARILTDAGWREELRTRTRKAHDLHFSWPAIAAKLLKHLGEA